MGKEQFAFVCFFGLLFLYSCHSERVSPVQEDRVSLSAFNETFGSPHIFDADEGVCYYMGAWGPGATLMKIRFQDDMILSMESEYYEEAVLSTYIPRLIESLRVEESEVDEFYRRIGINPLDVANRALMFLTNVMHQTYPNGYGEHYMTSEPYKDTPFETSYPVWSPNSYQQWNKWWQRKGHVYFSRFQPKGVYFMGDDR
ncbi:hypothetical protein F4Y59_03310 [Candidatus Poribacteria bacterium]|nr:hypothetical protein [Candidatus Poribacteria bacterium]MYK20255.1 hypothetical protein [Candidatus Poribacteria bacterium]